MITVQIPTALRRLTSGSASVKCSAANLDELFTHLFDLRDPARGAPAIKALTYSVQLRQQIVVDDALFRGMKGKHPRITNQHLQDIERWHSRALIVIPARPIGMSRRPLPVDEDSFAVNRPPDKVSGQRGKIDRDTERGELPHRLAVGVVPAGSRRAYREVSGERSMGIRQPCGIGIESIAVAK